MKNNRVTQVLHGHRKLLLLLLLLGVTVILSGCYVDPDRQIDDTDGLTIGTQGQNFDIVITTPPPATPAPTATVAAQQYDWSQWDFSADQATSQPSAGVQPTSAAGTTATSTPQTGTSSTPAPTQQNTTTDNSVLKSGSSGTAVKQLQDRLKTLGYYTGSVDGAYGAGTAQAVKDFQTVNSLTADGIAGTKTQSVLYGKYAIAKSSSTSGSSTSTGNTNPNTTPSTTANPYTNGKTNLYLRMGSTGDQVRILQNRLIYLDYLAGSADAVFAETTEAAVVAFQSRNNLTSDGVAGPATLEKLYSSSARKASSVVAYLGSLRQGMNGDGVRALQSKLKTLNYYSGSIDGDYGENTFAAVVEFQTVNGLTADGIAGKATLNLLYSGTGSSSGGSSSGGSSSTASDPIKYGETASSTGYKTLSTTNSPSTASVTALQTSLNSLGYYTGSLDGKYGGGTADAVRNYQTNKGLRVTGTAGPAMQRMLFGGTAANGSYSTLRPGDTGSDVRTLQYTLYELKFYDGTITGTYDEATENAVRNFQGINGLSIDGVAGANTLQILYSSNAKALTSEYE